MLIYVILYTFVEQSKATRGEVQNCRIILLAEGSVYSGSNALLVRPQALRYETSFLDERKPSLIV